MYVQQFGAFIAEQRTKKGYTQKELANLLLVTDKAISRWENGHGFPDIETLEPLADALDISVVELMHSKVNEENTDNTYEISVADEIMGNTIEIVKANRKKERRLVTAIFIMSIVLILLFSIFKSIPFVGLLGIVIMVVYLIAGVSLLIRTNSEKKQGFDFSGTAFYSVLFFIVVLAILCILLGVQVQGVVHPS